MLFTYRKFYENTEGDTSIKYWGDEAAGCIFIAKDTGRILLAHRSKTIEYEPNTWAGWGGKLDGDETPVQAVEREVEEETGFSGDYKINHIWTFKDPESDFVYYNYIVIIPHEFTPKLNWENDRSKWTEYGEWPHPLHYGMEALFNNAGTKIKKIIDLIKRNTKLKETVADVPPAIVQSAQQISPSFINYMKSAENSIKKGFDTKRKLWFPHASPEGGLPTIAYGHKIKNKSELDRMNKGISDSEAEQLLKKDIENAWGVVKSDLNYMTKGLNIPLSGDQKEMLIDFAFNLGTIKGFPKFVKSILNKDWDIAKKEYIRTYKDNSGKKHELSRNKIFFNRYLATK
jgi:8-oxo-dGTP pyrophosphatase MutT (NUDIX family)/GH24 family phage-related lysozyme (muramidase)